MGAGDLDMKKPRAVAGRGIMVTEAFQSLFVALLCTHTPWM